MNLSKLDAVDRGIPRRLSARQEDRYFDQGLVARLHDRIAVLLNGIELAEVCSWDVEKGEIVRRRRDQGGNLVLNESGVPRLERLTGKVEVRWLKGHSPTPDRPNGSAGRAA